MNILMRSWYFSWQYVILQLQCNECGYCKHAKFDIVLSAKPSFTAERIETDQDMKKTLASIDSESQNAHKRFACPPFLRKTRRYSQIAAIRTPLAQLASKL